MTYRKKLIEVALPLEAINRESAREKSIRHGHPSTLHLWWARRPLVACRAVLFSSLVDDPSSHPDKFPTEEEQETERQRLFGIIERLVKWENSNNEQVLAEARTEILKSTNGNPPPVYDPFCGGGSIPFEAQRLGLEAYGSDLNPVAVLINKALIEIPPKFANRPPVHPMKGGNEELFKIQWRGAAGLAEDVRYYGQWMRVEAEKRIGHLYPKVTLPKEYGGGEATVIAWLWARVVKCPNPACNAKTPISKTYKLSAKAGNEAYVEPQINAAEGSVGFIVRYGKGGEGSGNVDRRGAFCLVCNSPISLEHIRNEAIAKRMGQTLLAIVAEGNRRRAYISGNDEHLAAAMERTLDIPAWSPATDLPHQALGFRVQRYGMTTHASLFTQRQTIALSTFSDLISEVANNVSIAAEGNKEYGAAVATYLAFALDKAANYWSSLCSWYVKLEKMVSTFGLPTLSMVWDFAEANPFSDSSGNWSLGVEQAASVLNSISPSRFSGNVEQRDAAKVVNPVSRSLLVVTDPPYYDNIGYASLSDFFYVWLRHTLSKLYPQLFETLLTPKDSELIAEPGRFEGDRSKAITHFENGLAEAFKRMREMADAELPTSLFYAFKQQESDSIDENNTDTLVSSGWEKMLTGLVQSGFSVCGTWPIRTEQTGGLREAGRNSLASSIVLVCRPRLESAPIATRREFLSALKRELPEALKNLQHGNIAPVDLAQASIGPGMAVFSRYSKVVEADGSPMRVRTALQIINQSLDEVLAEQESNYDSDTRWAVAWFDQFGMEDAQYGIAETLSKAKNTSVNGMEEAGVILAKSGKVRLIKRDELPTDWDPATDKRLTVWEVTQHLIHKLEQEGESGAAAILAKVIHQNGSLGEIARDLAYRLFTTCERKGWTQEALAYNSLVVAWPEISRLASSQSPAEAQQMSLQI